MKVTKPINPVDTEFKIQNFVLKAVYFFFRIILICAKVRSNLQSKSLWCSYDEPQGCQKTQLSAWFLMTRDSCRKVDSCSQRQSCPKDWGNRCQKRTCYCLEIWTNIPNILLISQVPNYSMYYEVTAMFYLIMMLIHNQ